MIHILVVEDDKELNYAVCKYLSSNRYQPTSCLDATQAYDYLYSEQYDLIISDIMMPNIDGYEFTETVRQMDSNIPILFMTAKDDFSSKQRGYRLGIDDYMVKPIDFAELILHIEALLRRAKISSQKRIEIGEFILDENEMTATVKGEQIMLTLREFQVLFKLLSYPKQTFTRSQILNEFSGIENDGGLRTVDVHITNLRTKLAECTDFEIVTVRGLGYKAVLL
ncbi:DNA-binding response regulator [Enterococcus sp. JM4C]|uniref:response regulator transcription factor n=1 Tax=Candidatus Enterococcus huntleyi TaxID=1857217 RepID=UPI00137AED48|nr:response regulator transcription factor [Enterococcus sp. JM4C]KAF1296172.1 DNA-binding response regulator [Enterococcus sp. JM4C]